MQQPAPLWLVVRNLLLLLRVSLAQLTAMATYPVTSILWKGHVEDGPVPESNFVVSEGSSISAEQLQDGEVLVELLYLSVDPYMRGRMREMKVGCCSQEQQGAGLLVDYAEWAGLPGANTDVCMCLPLLPFPCDCETRQTSYFV